MRVCGRRTAEQHPRSGAPRAAAPAPGRRAERTTVGLRVDQVRSVASDGVLSLRPGNGTGRVNEAPSSAPLPVPGRQPLVAIAVGCPKRFKEAGAEAKTSPLPAAL
jgi:hypothetical protein